MKMHLLHGFVQLFGILVVMNLFSMGFDYLFLYLGILFLLYSLLLFLVPLHRLLALGIYTILTTLTIVIAVVHADNFHSYGPLLRESIDAIFQTSSAEAVNYLTIFSSPIVIPIIMLFMVFSLLTLWRIRDITLPVVVPTVLLVCALALTYFGRQVPLSIYAAANDYADTMASFNNNRKQLLDGLGPIKSDFKGTIVVFIGESIARQHLGIYGYPRRTTPSLSSIKDRLTVYRDVISPHSHTTESLSLALTFGRRDIDYTAAPDLINVARRAGLKTYWLSNQNTIGIWDNAVSALASQADVIKYHDPSSGYKLTRSIFDQALLTSLQEALAEPTPGGKLIFLHLMATHFPYCDVVPEDFEPDGLRYDDPPMDFRFLGNWLNYLQGELNEAQLITYFSSINCYDRAVSYVDKVLAGALAILSTDSAPSALLFIADHGEAVLFDSGHESRRHSHTHVEIPFVLWQNEAYKVPLILDPNRPGTLADLSYSVSQLAGITGIADQGSRSLFSPGYQVLPRTTLGGRVGYDTYDPGADNVERGRANLRLLNPPDKKRIWAHRMNTVGSLMVAREFFTGVEMDLVFSSAEKKFKVYHPPADDAGLDLEMQLRQDHGDLGYWLDWKNASRANVEEALARLELLDKKHEIRSRALIEIAALDGSARILADQGWRVSYYLPTGKILECLSHCPPEESASLAEELWAQFDSNGYTAVSFDIRLLAFVEANMLDRIQRDNIAAHTWNTEVDISAENAPSLLEPILGRRWIDTILVTFPNHFWR